MWFVNYILLLFDLFELLVIIRTILHQGSGTENSSQHKQDLIDMCAHRLVVPRNIQNNICKLEYKHFGDTMFAYIRTG